MPRRPDAGARERVLGAAAELFYARGVRAVGMAQVVEAAGCGKNVLYRHFPSKDALVAEFLRDFGAARALSTGRALAAVDDPGDALVELTRWVVRQAARADFQGCAVRNYLHEVRERDDLAGAVALDLVRSWRRQIDHLVTELTGDPASPLADQLWLVHEGLYSTGAYAGGPRGSERALDLVVQLVDGARSSRAPASR